MYQLNQMPYIRHSIVKFLIRQSTSTLPTILQELHHQKDASSSPSRMTKSEKDSLPISLWLNEEPTTLSSYHLVAAQFGTLYYMLLDINCKL